MKGWTLALIALSSLLLGGCCRPNRNEQCDNGPITYAQRAYLQQQSAECSPSTQNFDQQHLTPPLLDLAECDYTGEWERQEYETVDDWVARLRMCMCTNRDAINGLESEYNQLAEQERQIGANIRDLVSKNESLREMRSQLQAEQAADPDFRQLGSEAPPPFIVHFVKKGETLYSIARQYYNSSEMIDNIVRWNGGWIRRPEELVAGLGLVLFPKTSDKTGQSIVENYIDSLEERVE